MKPQTFVNKSVLLGSIGVLFSFSFSGCTTNGNPLFSLPGIFGEAPYENRTTAQNQYLYYPDYDLYYNRNTGDFISFENNRWIARKSPRNVSSDRLFASRSVSLQGYDTPEQHRAMYYRQTRYENDGRPAPVDNRRWFSGSRRSNPTQ
jgi:hypothetical protein